MAKLNGPAIVSVAVGGLFLYAGMKGYSVLTALQNIVRGTSPNTGQSTSLLTASGGGTTTGSGGTEAGATLFPTTANSPITGGTNSENQALGKSIAASTYGWTGAEWTDLNQLIEDESGWSDTVKNANSDASGIGQNINGFNDTDYPYGNAQAQIIWTFNYIVGRYGTPANALAHENEFHWY